MFDRAACRLVARENEIASSVESFLRGVEGFDAPGPSMAVFFFV
jgi:hypothetical protein